jgi:hypothetical protein
MLNSLPAYRYDYTDSFEAPTATADDRTPEQLARAVFEGAPRPVRWFLLAGFRYGLGLRFGPRPSPEHVLGWAIIDRAPDSITLESGSWLLTSRLIFQTEDACASVSTFVRYERPIAKVIWPPISILHCQIVPRLLRRAATRTTATQRPAGQPSSDTRQQQTPPLHR